jgi:hypothetical protein
MDSEEEDQRLEHHRQPPHFLDLDELFKATGVEYLKVSTTFWKKLGNGFEDVKIKLHKTLEITHFRNFCAVLEQLYNVGFMCTGVLNAHPRGSIYH